MDLSRSTCIDGDTMFSSIHLNSDTLASSIIELLLVFNVPSATGYFHFGESMIVSDISSFGEE